MNLITWNRFHVKGWRLYVHFVTCRCVLNMYQYLFASVYCVYLFLPLFKKNLKLFDSFSGFECPESHTSLLNTGSFECLSACCVFTLRMVQSGMTDTSHPPQTAHILTSQKLPNFQNGGDMDLHEAALCIHTAPDSCTQGCLLGLQWFGNVSILAFCGYSHSSRP